MISYTKLENGLNHSNKEKDYYYKTIYCFIDDSRSSEGINEAKFSLKG